MILEKEVSRDRNSIAVDEVQHSPCQQDDKVSWDDPKVNFAWMDPISASAEPYTWDELFHND